MAEPRLNIRLDEQLRRDFSEWCKKNGTTPSDEIRRYITKVVRTNNLDKSKTE